MKKVKMKTVRLNKFLSECGIASRRKSEILIEEGRVSVNDNIVTDLATKVDPKKDNVEVDGEPVKPESYVYYLLNKPKGFISSTKDEKGRRTVTEIIRSGKSIFPVGRLDYNTTGVLLLTNDGNFSNRLTHPGNRVPKVYFVKLEKELTKEDKEKLLKGIYLDGKKGKFLKISPVKNDWNLVEITCEEGRNHFVKNMFNQLGYNVKSLHRKSFAGINDDLELGSYRKLKDDEISKLIAKYEK